MGVNQVFDSGTPTLSNDYATGNVTGSGASGGLVGEFQGGILSNSYATGSVYSPNGYNVGGLVGSIVRQGATTISNDYATGAVTGSTNVGGLIGSEGIPFKYTVLVENVFATGSVVASTSNAGGLIGNSSETLIHAYATGQVSSPNNAGGLIGINSGNVSDSYWDMGTSGRALGVGSDSAPSSNVTAIGGSTGLDPYAQSTYVGFDFSPSGPWTIVESVGRPTLKTTN